MVSFESGDRCSRSFSLTTPEAILQFGEENITRSSMSWRKHYDLQCREENITIFNCVKKTWRDLQFREENITIFNVVKKTLYDLQFREENITRSSISWRKHYDIQFREENMTIFNFVKKTLRSSMSWRKHYAILNFAKKTLRSSISWRKHKLVLEIFLVTVDLSAVTTRNLSMQFLPWSRTILAGTGRDKSDSEYAFHVVMENNDELPSDRSWRKTQSHLLLFFNAWIKAHKAQFSTQIKHILPKNKAHFWPKIVESVHRFETFFRGLPKAPI